MRFTDGGSLPPGLSIDQDTGVVSGTINADASTSGPYEVTITATDDNGASVTQTFDWTINNPAPIAINNVDIITENAGAAGNVITDDDGSGVDSDPDGDAIQVVAVNGSSANLATTVTGSGGGQFTIGADGTYRFATGSDFDDLAPTETRNTSITYTISDGQGGSSTATLTVQVNGTNDEPTVIGTIADQSSNDSDTIAPLNVSSFFDDLDSNDTLEFDDNWNAAARTIDRPRHRTDYGHHRFRRVGRWAVQCHHHGNRRRRRNSISVVHMDGRQPLAERH